MKDEDESLFIDWNDPLPPNGGIWLGCRWDIKIELNSNIQTSVTFVIYTSITFEFNESYYEL